MMKLHLIVSDNEYGVEECSIFGAIRAMILMFSQIQFKIIQREGYCSALIAFKKRQAYT
jgi:hypothetical protein